MDTEEVRGQVTVLVAESLSARAELAQIVHGKQVKRLADDSDADDESQRNGDAEVHRNAG